MNTPRCIKCEGSGIYYRPNGDADFTPEYCICAEGEAAERSYVSTQNEVNFIPSEGEVNVTRK